MANREVGSEGSVEQTHAPMHKNRIRGGGRGTSGRDAAKSISIKRARRRFGGGVWKAVKLTSGGLRCCRPCPSWSEWRLGRELPNAAQKSAEGHSRSGRGSRP